MGDGTETNAVAVYLETLVDSNLLGQHVIEPVNKFIRGNTGELTENQLKLILSASKLLEIQGLTGIRFIQQPNSR